MHINRRFWISGYVITLCYNTRQNLFYLLRSAQKCKQDISTLYLNSSSSLLSHKVHSVSYQQC